MISGSSSKTKYKSTYIDKAELRRTEKGNINYCEIRGDKSTE